MQHLEKNINFFLNYKAKSLCFEITRLID